MTDIIIKMAASSTTLTAVADETGLATTGAGESTQNGPRRWERPWSVQEIHAEAGNWSLAGDSGLLQHLQEFSQRVISRTHQIGKEVDDLVHEAKLMDVRVGNVINDFIMLANTQFVENRVYDEDVSQEPSTKEEKKVEQKTKEQREAELIPRVSLALKLGVDVIENSFVKLDPRVVDSDSEEEDNTYVSEPILEAKDPYVSRPLPFLIGTPQFMEDDNVGLLDESSDEEEEIDQGSMSVSEEDKDGDESDSEYSASEESEEEERRKVAHRKHRAQTKTSAVSESSDADSGQDIFSDKRSGSQKSAGGDSGDISDSEEEDDDAPEKPAALPRGPKDFNAELAARLGTAAPKQAADRPEADDQWKDKSADYKSQDSLSSGVHQNIGNKGKKNRDNLEVKTDKGTDKKKHSKNIVEDDDLFAQDNGQDDDDIFGKDKGLFSSSKGLFDDDDEDVDQEGGLFADVKKPPPKVQKPDKKADSLFNDGITNEEIEDSKMPEDRPRTKSGRIVPTGGVSIFGTGEDLAPASKLESSGTHIIKKPTAQPAVASSKSAGGKAASGGGGGGGLFDDSEEEEDDLFSGASKKVETDRRASSNTSKATATTAKKSDLFADEEEDGDDLFGSMAAATTKKKAPGNVGITVESYDEEERVKEKRLEDEQLRKQATPEKKLPPGAVSMFGKSPNPLVEALKNQQQTISSEEEDNDLSEEGRNSLTSSIHSTSSTTLPPAQKSAEGTRNMGSSSSRTSSIFTDDRAEDDLFSIKPKSDSKSVTDSQGSRKQPELDHKASSKVKSVKDSLFDSSGDDEDVDIFSSIAKPAASTKADKGVSLFGDTETTGSAKAGTAAASRLASQPANRKTGASLFDDNLEEEAAEPLFPGRLSDSAGGTDTPKNKTQGLFARDDLLFGTTADEDPFVDLFSSKAPVTEQSHSKETQKHTSQTATSSSRPATASLFDGGDDGDDDSGLFSVAPVTKPAAAAAPASVAAAPATVAAPMMKTISGVTETESTDAVEVKVKEKPEVKEIRKPAGAVSMFGGVDPASVLAKIPTHPSNEDEMSKGVKRDDKEMKKDEKVTRTEEKITGKTPVLKPKPSTDLFGGGKDDDDDDDDLFSPKATVKSPAKADVLGESTHVSTKEGAATPKAEPVKPRKPAGAVPMFGGVDPLAFLKKESVAEVKDETTDEGNEKGKPLPPRPAPKPKVIPREKQEENLKIKSQNGAAAAELFGDDGDDSDDLFVVSKQKASPPQVAPKSKAAASHSSVDSPKSEREPQSPTVARAKALAGAVPMFRGIDPFAGMKKKSLSSEPEEDSTSQKEKPPTFVDPLAVLTSSVSSTAALKHPASPVIVAKKSVDMTAAINSTYMLPDETRSDQDTDLEKSGSLDFEESTETETLTSASKDRPKLSRRRPQSRKARVLAAAQTGINFGDGPTATPPDQAVLKMPDVADKPHPGTVESSNGTITGPVLVNHLSDSKKFTSNPKSADLFGNDDLLDGLTVSTDQPLAVDVRKTVGDEIFSKDLFHGSSRITNGAAEDLFSDFNKQTVIPPARSEIIAEKTTENEKDEIDGLFSKSSGKTKKDSLSAFLGNNGDLYPTSPLTAQPKAKVDDDIDDLFTSSAKSSTRKSNLASEILRGDDLFSAPKSSSSLSRGGSIADSKSADIFEDIHDVFGASSLGRHKDTSSINPEKDGLTGTRRLEDSKNARPKQPVTKEANLLMDDTDIFSDVPKPTPREPKKKTSKKVVEKNVFRDDIDDIFANTTAATIKPKKEVRKKVTKPAAVISDNIFDDPLS